MLSTEKVEQNNMKISNMRTNHVKNPLGFEMDKVTFSWVTEGKDIKSTKQKTCEVVISLDGEFNNIVFNSGVCTDINSLAYTPDFTLEPRKRYYWRVTVTGDKGDTVASQVAWFETGKMDEPWVAKWITPDLDKEIHPLIRKEVVLPDGIKSARLYISGLGLYTVEINGEKIGEEYFAPGFTSYDFWVQYETYDVTKNIKSGNNAIGIMLGNGWYRGRFGFDGGHYDIYGDKFLAIAELIVTLEDGSEVVVGSDNSWRCSQSPVEFSGIYDGEIYNSTKELSGWSKAGFNQDSWDKVNETVINTEKFQGRLSLPIKVKEEIKVKEIIITPKNEIVLDFGQIITGWVRFNINKDYGHKVMLQYSEILQNQCFYRDNLRTAKAEFTYICDGAERKNIEPHYTFFGFRYVKLNGFGQDINADDFIACSIYSDLEQTGFIETSNENVNKLFLNALWSQKDNFLDVPTDCPQRDERMGWTGDAQIFAMTACFNMYSPAFFNKYMKDLREEQKRLDGSVPFVVPMIKPDTANGFIKGHGSAAWGDAATIIPWVLYKQYGDKELLANQFDTMKDWVDYIKRVDDESGSTRLWNKGFQFGDWLALDGKDMQSPMGGTDVVFIASAYYYYSTSIVAKAAKVLGKMDIAQEYSKLALEIKDAINNEYFTASGRCAVSTQTAMVLALYMGLVNDNVKKRVSKDLEKKLIEDNVHLKTGFVGTTYLCHALSENNLNKYAYKLLLNDDFPSWLYEVKMGATTIWERWNSVLPDGSISGTEMNSLNHYAYGSIVEWMYTKVLGINPIEEVPGFKKFIIAPRPNKSLKYAKGYVNTASGLIESSWEFGDNGQITFEFTVPFDTESTIVLPIKSISSLYINGIKVNKYEGVELCQESNSIKCKVNSGKYCFICQVEEK